MTQIASGRWIVVDVSLAAFFRSSHLLTFARHACWLLRLFAILLSADLPSAASPVTLVPTAAQPHSPPPSIQIADRQRRRRRIATPTRRRPGVRPRPTPACCKPATAQASRQEQRPKAQGSKTIQFVLISWNNYISDYFTGSICIY